MHCTRNCRSKSEKQRAGWLAPVPDRPAGAAYAPQPSPESEWWSGCTHQPRKGSAGPQGGGSNSTLEFDSPSRIFPTRPNGRACCRARHVRLLSRPGRWCGRTHTTTTRTWLGSTRPPARAQCCSSTTGWTAPAPKRRRASAGLPQHRHRHSCHVCHPRGAKCVLSLEPPVRVLLAWPGPQHTHCNISILRCTI